MRDGVYAVKLIARGNRRNVGVIGYQIGIKKGRKFETNLHWVRKEWHAPRKKRVYTGWGRHGMHPEKKESTLGEEGMACTQMAQENSLLLQFWLECTVTLWTKTQTQTKMLSLSQVFTLFLRNIHSDESENSSKACPLFIIGFMPFFWHKISTVLKMLQVFLTQMKNCCIVLYRPNKYTPCGTMEFSRHFNNMPVASFLMG